MASRARGHRRRSMHPQLHSSLSCLAWPMTHRAFSQPPSPLCFLPLSSLLVLTWTGHGYTKGLVCHRNQGSLKTSGGNRSRAVPSQGWPPTQWCQLPVATLWRCLETEKRVERDLRRLELHFRACDISFVLPLTDLASIPLVGWDTEFGDNGGPLPQMRIENNAVYPKNKKKPQPCLMWPMTFL